MIGLEKTYEYKWQAANLGHSSALFHVGDYYAQQASVNDRLPLKMLYMTAAVDQKLFAEKSALDIADYTVEEELGLKLIKAEREQGLIDADEFISQMTPVIYIDELHPQYGRFGF